MVDFQHTHNNVYDVGIVNTIKVEKKRRTKLIEWSEEAETYTNYYY